MAKLESDLWKRLVAEAGAEEDDAIARAASVAVKEAEAELTAAGFDVPAERAKAAAFLDALENGAPEALDAQPPESEARIPDSPPSAATAVAQDPTPHVSSYPHSHPHPNRKRDRPVVLWIAVAATITVAAGALYAAIGQPHPPPPPPPSPTTPAPPSPAPPDLVAAADLRRQAAAACDAQEWSTCLAQLDEARDADPGGDEKPAVTTLRTRAIAGILKKPKPPVPP